MLTRVCILLILCSFHFGFDAVLIVIHFVKSFRLCVIVSDEYSAIFKPHRSGTQPCLKDWKLAHFFGLVLMSKLMEVIPTYMYHMTGIICYKLPLFKYADYKYMWVMVWSNPSHFSSRKVPFEKRVFTVLNWLRLPEHERYSKVLIWN